MAIIYTNDNQRISTYLGYLWINRIIDLKLVLSEPILTLLDPHQEGLTLYGNDYQSIS